MKRVEKDDEEEISRTRKIGEHGLTIWHKHQKSVFRALWTRPMDTSVEDMFIV